MVRIPDALASWECQLYKAGLKGALNVGIEPYSEFIASNIAKDILGDNSISYDLEMFKNKLCSKCKLFTNESYGYVPFYKFINANKKYTLNDVLKICTDMGYEKECRQMILIDSIIFNQDRHLGNFGFLVDNDTFEIIKFAPLFDYNLSMLCNALIEDLQNFSKYEEEFQLGHKLGGIFSEVGKAILTSDLKELIPKGIEFPIHRINEYNLNEERNTLLMDILEQNINKITGKKFYSVFPSVKDISFRIDDISIIK